MGVEDTAKEKLIEMTRVMVDRMGGKACIDNMMELGEKKLKVEGIQKDNKRIIMN